MRVEGRENVPARGPAVLAANHQSFCDSFFLPLVVRRKVTFLAKAEYFDSWRTAWFFRAAGQIPIRRGGGPVSERALATAGDVLDRGRLLGLYPEGTRSPDAYVHRGRTGVARLSRECGVAGGPGRASSGRPRCSRSTPGCLRPLQDGAHPLRGPDAHAAGARTPRDPWPTTTTASAGSSPTT